MRMLPVAAVVMAVALGLGGCAKDGAKPDKPDQPKRSGAGREIVAPPANSKLAKVKEGMTVGDVEDVLGRPNDQNEYITGKAFIPWNFGRDRSRVAYFYKGLGRVVFQGAGGFSRRYTVHHVEYDPSETGRAN